MGSGKVEAPGWEVCYLYISACHTLTPRGAEWSDGCWGSSRSSCSEKIKWYIQRQKSFSHWFGILHKIPGPKGLRRNIFRMKNINMIVKDKKALQAAAQNSNACLLQVRKGQPPSYTQKPHPPSKTNLEQVINHRCSTLIDDLFFMISYETLTVSITHKELFTAPSTVL